jgi:hypothetical protein
MINMHLIAVNAKIMDSCDVMSFFGRYILAFQRNILLHLQDGFYAQLQLACTGAKIINAIQISLHYDDVPAQEFYLVYCPASGDKIITVNPFMFSNLFPE